MSLKWKRTTNWLDSISPHSLPKNGKLFSWYQREYICLAVLFIGSGPVENCSHGRKKRAKRKIMCKSHKRLRPMAATTMKHSKPMMLRSNHLKLNKFREQITKPNGNFSQNFIITAFHLGYMLSDRTSLVIQSGNSRWFFFYSIQLVTNIKCFHQNGLMKILSKIDKFKKRIVKK